LPKAVAKPVKDYFLNNHEEREKSRKDLFAANHKVKELETELKNEREKNQAERNRLREEHKKIEAEQKELLARTTARITAELKIAKDMVDTYIKANEVLEAYIAELRANLKEADKIAAESIKAQAIKADELKKQHAKEMESRINSIRSYGHKKIREAYELGTKRGAQAFLQQSAAAMNLSLVPQQQPSSNSTGNA
jgi:seryl-tRNA synthetase